MTKHAGQGAAILVLLAVTGLIVLIGVILLMMWMQPDIEHRPSVHSKIGTDVRNVARAKTGDRR
jgi:hypothetical protein